MDAHGHAPQYTRINIFPSQDEKEEPNVASATVAAADPSLLHTPFFQRQHRASTRHSKSSHNFKKKGMTSNNETIMSRVGTSNTSEESESEREWDDEQEDTSERSELNYEADFNALKERFSQGKMLAFGPDSIHIFEQMNSIFDRQRQLAATHMILERDSAEK
eukprot:Ihof_evm5s461 gene=Ihof_evmTU5s461